MELPIILIVLFAATCHAVWNASIKLGDDQILSIAGMQTAALLFIFPLLFFVGFPHADSWPYLLLSIPLHFFYYLSLARAYRYGDFAQAYPVARGAAPLLVALLGAVALGESLRAAEWLALGGIICGIMIFATRRIDAVLQQRKALSSALITAAFIGAYTVVDGAGARKSQNVFGYAVWMSLFDCLPVIGYAWMRRTRGEIFAFAAKWRMCLFAAALGLTAWWLVIWALTLAPVALVSALRETSVIIAALIGAYYFKEPAGKRRVFASVVIFFSIALLAMAA